MRQTYIATFLGFLIIFTYGFATPSGGPYGPLPQNYSLPSLKDKESAATIRYAAPDGVADASGMRPDAPTTLTNAIELSRTGDYVILRGGTYRTGSIRFNQGITIQPYLEEKPIIKGTEIAGQWTQVSDSLWQTEWTRLFPAEPAGWWRPERHLESTPLHRFNYDMVFADGVRLESAGSIEEVTENSYFIDYAHGVVTIGKDPSEQTIEITAHDSALVRTMRPVDGRPNDQQGPTIRGITFSQYARLALLVEGLEPWKPMDPSGFGKDVIGTTLEHLTISHCSRVAGYFRGDDLTIRHCKVADCGTEGIYVINSSNVLLERNIVTRTNSHTPIQGYYASAVKIFNQSYRVVCRDNLIIDNPHSSGIWYDVGNRHSVVVNNWFENTNNAAFFEISEGAICAGNQFVNCTRGVRILNSADIGVYQNTLYNSAIEVIRSLRSSEAGDHFGWHASAGPNVANRDRHVVINNLLLVDDPEFNGIVRIMEQSGVEEIAKNRQIQKLDGNVYVRSSAASSAALLMSGNFVYPPSDQGFDYFDSLVEFQRLDPTYEQNGRNWKSYDEPVVQSPALKRFNLSSSFPDAHHSVELPAAALDWLGKTDEQPGFPGAWPALP